MRSPVRKGFAVKGIVVFDSYFGNTKRVAEAIVEQIKSEGHEAELRNVREKYPSPPLGDFMLVGSPNRMGSVTGRVKRFVRKLDREAWSNKPIAIFTTVAHRPDGEMTEKQKASYEKWALRAGPKLRDKATDRGLKAVDMVLAVEVGDQKGPLVEGGIEQTKQFTHDFLEKIKK
jgi:flavodoxin